MIVMTGIYYDVFYFIVRLVHKQVFGLDTLLLLFNLKIVSGYMFCLVGLIYRWVVGYFTNSRIGNCLKNVRKRE